jgi:beta-N-acetylhexosaminidase
LIAAELKAIGVDVDCAPVLDVPVAGADQVIGDRAYGSTPERVAAIGRAFALGLLDGGVLPVIKHIPGHGRGTVDSHLKLPVVETPLAELEASDFQPFRALADMPFGMTAHIQYSAIDGAESATCSAKVVQDIIRKSIGFDGLLMTDDLSMKALGGTLTERAEKSLAAGCDLLLHCNGQMEEMAEVAAAAPPLSDEARRRWLLAAARRVMLPEPFDGKACRAALDRLLKA